MQFPLVFDRDSAEHRMYRIVGFAALAVVTILLWRYLPAFQVKRLSRTLAMAVAILGLNLVVGYSGLLALCQSAFIALGAFVSASLIVDHGWDYWMTIPMALLATFFMGVVLGIPALKIKGLYLAMTTVAFAAAFPSITKLELHFPPSWLPGDFWRGDLSIAHRTGGANGRALAEPNGLGEDLTVPSWFPWFDVDERYAFGCVLILAVIAFWAVGNLVKSRPGRAVISIRDNEIGAAVSGVNLRYFKVINFGLSAALGGLAGVMWAMFSGFVAEQDFTFILMVDLLVGLVVGGVGTVSGALIGAMVVVFGRWLCQTYFNYSLASIALWGILLGFAMFVVQRLDHARLKMVSAGGAVLSFLFLVLPTLGLNVFKPLDGLGFHDMGGGPGWDWSTFLATAVFVVFLTIFGLAVAGATQNSEAITRAGAFVGIMGGLGGLGTWLWAQISVPGWLWLGLAGIALAWLAYGAGKDQLVAAGAAATTALIAISWFQAQVGLNGWITALLVIALVPAAGYYAMNAPATIRPIIAGAGTLLSSILIIHWASYRSDIPDGLYQLNGDGPLSQAIFGIVLIVVVFFAPQGIVGAWRKSWSNIVQIRPVPPALPAGAESLSVSSATTESTEA
ncbi:MAG: branched-chain amino acid ABC transporter permease [Actinomycetota bacterium]